MVRFLVTAVLSLALLVTSAAAFAQGDLPALGLAAAPDTVSDWSGFQSRLHREGRVFISGQPDSTALLELPARGIACVINLRTPKEMENRVPFDEAGLLQSLDVAYEWIPQGGDEHPYNAAAVDSFAAVLARHDGPVLLHCTVAWRASHLWAAYLVRHHGFGVAEAYGRGRAMGIGATPFEKYLEKSMALVPAE